MRAAVVLVPLLGITNVVSMSKTPLEKSVWEFALWSYGTHFLTSFQGFFIAFLYCFLNGEVRSIICSVKIPLCTTPDFSKVRTAVMKSISVHFSQIQVRRNSFFSGIYEAGQNQVNHESEMTQGSVREGQQRQRFLRRQRSKKNVTKFPWIR